MASRKIETIRTSITLPSGLMERILKIGERRGMVTMTDAIRTLLTEAVEQDEERNRK